jgi:N-terminal domain of Peptidase_S41 in eukaryotic IRBP/Peptidase family S41
VERAELDRLEHYVNDEILARFPAGTVRRVALLAAADDPRIGPDELLVRVFAGLGATAQEAGAAAAEEALASWAAEHENAMRRLRRELSLRLPPARLLEFTTDDGDPGSAHRIVMEHDPELASGPVPPREIVQTAIAVLRSRYVFPDRAAQAATEIEARLEAGEYDDLGEPELAERLTSHLYAVCADKHLRVRVLPERRRPRPAPVERERHRREMEQIGRLDNFGIHRVERLDGNVGYIDLRRVALPQNAGASIAAAMELVSSTYALIIDLRRNGGGSPDGLVFWCSYLFDGPGTHFNDIFEAESGQTRQYWSVPYVRCPPDGHAAAQPDHGNLRAACQVGQSGHRHELGRHGRHAGRRRRRGTGIRRCLWPGAEPRAVARPATAGTRGGGSSPGRAERPIGR